MGAWGTGAYDNDTAADWFYGLQDCGLFDLIDKGLNSEYDDEVRAAAWLVQRLGVSAMVYDADKLGKHKKLAINKLTVLLNNSEYTGCWVDEDEIKASLKKQIDEIENPDSSPGLLEKMGLLLK